MTSIAFEAVVENGVILIPPEYQGKIHSPALVSVLTEIDHEPIIHWKTKDKQVSKEDFAAMDIDTRNFVFNREEANERR